MIAVNHPSLECALTGFGSVAALWSSRVYCVAWRRECARSLAFYVFAALVYGTDRKREPVSSKHSDPLAFGQPPTHLHHSRVLKGIPSVFKIACHRHSKTTPTTIVRMGINLPSTDSRKRSTPIKDDKRMPPPRLMAVTYTGEMCAIA